MFLSATLDGWIDDYYVRQVNGVKLADIMFSLLSVRPSDRLRTQSHWFEWRWEMYGRPRCTTQTLLCTCITREVRM